MLNKLKVESTATSADLLPLGLWKYGVEVAKIVSMKHGVPVSSFGNDGY